MYLYTTKNLLEVLPLNIKSFKECGISDSDITQIYCTGHTHSIILIESESLLNNNLKYKISKLSKEQKNTKILELQSIEQKEIEDYEKTTVEYKIDILKTGLQSVLAGDMQSLAYLLYPDDFKK